MWCPYNFRVTEALANQVPVHPGALQLATEISRHFTVDSLGYAMLYHVLPSQSILEQLRMQLNTLNGFVNVFGPDERRSQIDISCPASYQKDWSVDHNEEYYVLVILPNL